MKIIFLLPPSEGKNAGGVSGAEKLTFQFKKPLKIAKNASEKDLKCKGARYEEGIRLNKQLCNSPSIPLNGGGSEGNEQGEFLPTISRYSGVMYNAINYEGMSESGKKYFEENFIILSGMYGLVSPLDNIGNYKLPIETKGLYNFWGDSITEVLDKIGADYIVDMLPGSYKKMIDFKKFKTQIISINFLHRKDGELKQITHGVKKVKGEYIKNICERGFTDIPSNVGKKLTTINIIS